MQGDLETLAEAAEIIWPDVGRWLYEEWARHNRELFDGQLDPIGVRWGLTPHGHALGHFDPSTHTITLHESLIDPSGDAWRISHKLGTPFASDVLLHEMIHQKIDEIDGIEDGGRSESPNSQSPHNNPYWVAEINRLSDMLDFDCEAQVIRQKRVEGDVTWFVPDGCLSMEQLGSWPHCVRDDSYYESAPDSR